MTLHRPKCLSVPSNLCQEAALESVGTRLFQAVEKDAIPPVNVTRVVTPGSLQDHQCALQTSGVDRGGSRGELKLELTSVD